MKKVLLGIILVALVFTVIACGETKNNGKKDLDIVGDIISSGESTSKETTNNNKEKEKDSKDMEKFGDINRYSEVTDNPIVKIEMEDGNTITIELYPKIAPNSVENFVSLINQGFYDGLIFHRVIPGFMAQGGCPKGNGTGGPGYSIVGEFKENGFDNSLSHDVGVLSMARSSDPDSAGSQFFIVTSESAKDSLDGRYAPFGKVIEGMDEVMTIVNAKCEYTTAQAEDAYMRGAMGEELSELDEKLAMAYMGYNVGITLDRPIEEQKIKKITVDTKGVEYATPNKLSE